MFIVQLSLQSMPVLLRWLRGWRDERIKFQTPHPRTFWTRKEVLKSLKYKCLKKKNRLPDYDDVSHLGQTQLSLQHPMALSHACTFFQCGQPPNYFKRESVGFKTISHHVWDQVTQVHGWTCPKQLTKEAIVSTSQREAKCGDGGRACIPFASQK